MKWRNFAPLDSAADCVEISSRSNEKNSDVRGSAIRPAMRRCGEIPANSARSAEIQRNPHLIGMGGCNFAPHGSVVDCVEISSLNTAKSRWFADPPSGRFYGEGAKFRRSPTDRPELDESANYLGAKGRNFAPYESAAERVGASSENPEKSRTYADPPSGWSFRGGARFMGSRPIGRNSAKDLYTWVERGLISHPMNLRPRA